jgi:hypothetical protein
VFIDATRFPIHTQKVSLPKTKERKLSGRQLSLDQPRDRALIYALAELTTKEIWEIEKQLGNKEENMRNVIHYFMKKGFIEKLRPSERGKIYGNIKIILTDVGKKILKEMKVDEKLLDLVRKYRPDINTKYQTLLNNEVVDSINLSPTTESHLPNKIHEKIYTYQWTSDNNSVEVLRINDNEGNYLDFLFKDKITKYDCEYLFIRTIMEDELSEQDIQKIILHLKRKSERIGRKITDVISKERNLVEFINNKAIPTSICQELVTTLERDLFSGSFDIIKNNPRKLEESYSIYLEGVGEIRVPKPKFISDFISRCLSLRYLPIENKTKDEIRANSPIEIDIEDEKDLIIIKKRNNKPIERKVLVVDGSLTTAGKRFRETLRLISKGENPNNAEDLVSFGLIERKGRYINLTERGKLIYERLTSL